MRYKRVFTMLEQHGKSPLSVADRKRIKDYLSIQAVTLRWFSSWHYHRPTPSEILKGDLIGAITPLYDDLIDQDGYDHNSIVSGNHSNPRIEVLRNLLVALEAELSHPELFRDFLHKLGKAQSASRGQETGEIESLTHIDAISSDKGGYSTLLYRLVLDIDLGRDEEEIIYALGATLQLLNDIFDLYEDSIKNKTTRATLSNPADLMTYYRGKVEQTMTLIDASLSLPSAVRIEILLVLCRGFVAIEQYTTLNDLVEVWEPSSYDRKDMIVDMEKLKNLERVSYWVRELT